MSRKFPFFKQLDLMDCGPTCLKMVTAFYGKNVSREYLRERTRLSKDGVSIGALAETAESLGLQSLVLSCSYETLLENIPLPCIAYWRQRHFIVVYKVDSKFVWFGDPGFGIIKYSKQEFLTGWIPQFDKKNEDVQEGIVLVLETTPEFFNEREKRTPHSNTFGFVAPFFKPHRKLVAQLILGLVVGSLTQLFFPFLTQSIVDTGISGGDIAFINLLLIGQLILFLSQTFTEIFRSWLLLYITTRINISLLSSFLSKLIKLPIAFFDVKTTGDLLQRIQDNSRIQNFLSTGSLSILFSIFNVLIFGSVLCYYSGTIFLIFAGAATFYIFWFCLFLKKRALLDYRRFDQAAGNQSATLQMLSGMQEIKLNNSGKRRRWEWETIQARLFKLSMKSLTLSQTQTIGGDFILQLMGILITFVAAKHVIGGTFSIGKMLSVQFIIGQLNVPVKNFILFAQTYQDAKISLERISEIYEKENELTDVESIDQLPAFKDIHLQDVGFEYEAGMPVLEHINVTLPHGKVTAIVGSSGSGKTTLLKLLLKFYKPTKGKITVDNDNLVNINSNVWRANIGVVMQEGFIFSDTIERNISESDSERKTDRFRLAHAANIANIETFITGLPNGYKTQIGANGIQLSGGQKQRILIARAVYKKPAFLLFDEATSALDANNEAAIMQNLQEVYKGKTVVVIAHRLSTVKSADQILVLEQGKLIEAGNHESLINTRGVYYDLVKNQLELAE